MTTSAVNPLNRSAEVTVLCVDLDGTLVRTDTLIESLHEFRVLRRRPRKLFLCITGRITSRAAFKRLIAENADLKPEHLPYHRDFLSWLRKQKECGRTLVLATGADELTARPIADHLGIFDEVLASDGSINLTGLEKLLRIRAKFPGKFDYAGDSRSDLPLFEACDEAILVSCPESLIARTRDRNRLIRVFPRPPGSTWQAVIKTLRPHQWLKNLICFTALITSHQLFAPGVPLRAAILFGSFSLCASSAYVLNDLLDLEFDRQHHMKLGRPFASGRLPLPWPVSFFSRHFWSRRFRSARCSARWIWPFLRSISR